MQPSRRAFLTGATRLGTAWGRFCARLARSTRGRVDDSGSRGEAGWARFEPACAQDVQHAVILCAEAGVRIVPPGLARPPGPAILIDPIRLRAIRQLPAGLCAEPGASLADVQAIVPGIGAGAPSQLSLLEWLADPVWHAHWPQAATAAGGVLAATVILADGTCQQLGPFGATTQTRPLEPAAARLVAALFTLVHEPVVQQLRAASAPGWGARYRLDALLGQPPNLAHLLLGGAGTLAWPEQLWLAPRPTGEAAGAAVVAEAGLALEARIKHAFDPAGVFAGLPLVV